MMRLSSTGSFVMPEASALSSFGCGDMMEGVSLIITPMSRLNWLAAATFFFSYQSAVWHLALNPPWLSPVKRLTSTSDNARL
jgi:hypothetical protein